MKKILIILFVILGANALFSQEIEFSIKSENLKGNVKTFYHKTFKIAKESDELHQKYAIKYHYDNKGMLTSQENFGDDNKLDSKKVFTYSKNKIAKIILLNSADKPTKIITYTYKNNNLVSIKKEGNKGKIEHETTYFYSEKDILLSKTKTIPSIGYTITESYVYNNKTGHIVVKAKKARIGTSKETFEYNNKGEISKKSDYNAIGELFSVIDYEYNERGDKTSLKKYDVDGQLTYTETYKYEYDSQNNWVKKTSYKKDKKDSEETREFVYY